MSRFKRVVRKIARDSHLQRPSRDAVSVAMRRENVRAIICKRGRVCSGTPPCPCWALPRAGNIDTGPEEAEDISYKFDGD